jgi:hypothetical protein
MISPDDPRLHAYISGGLSPEEATRLESELADDPAARERVAQLRAQQGGLGVNKEADCVVELPKKDKAARPWPLPAWFTRLATAVCVVLIAGAVLLPTGGEVRCTAPRAVDASHLRQVGQASLIAASDHNNQLPRATDVWDYARQLAVDGGLDDGTMWISSLDPARDGASNGVSTVVDSDKRTILPSFLALKPSFAVPLGELNANMPGTTPVAWTRGLQPDGTWAADSPYGTDGGHIVFLAGNVEFFKNVKNSLVSFDGKRRTSNILEALPPGTRIGEYVPNDKEKRDWASANRIRGIAANVSPLFLPVIWVVSLFVLIIQTVRRKWPAWLWVLFVSASILLAMISSIEDRHR